MSDFTHKELNTIAVCIGREMVDNALNDSLGFLRSPQEIALRGKMLEKLLRKVEYLRKIHPLHDAFEAQQSLPLIVSKA